MFTFGTFVTMCIYIYVSRSGPLSNMCDDILINTFVCLYTCQIYLYFLYKPV